MASSLNATPTAAAGNLRDNLQDMESKVVASSANFAVRSQLNDTENKARDLGRLQSTFREMESKVRSTATGAFASDNVMSSLQDMENKALASAPGAASSSAPGAASSSAPDFQSNLQDMEGKVMASAVDTNIQSDPEGLTGKVTKLAMPSSSLDQTNNASTSLQKMENKVSNPNETNRSASNLATSSVEGSLERKTKPLLLPLLELHHLLLLELHHLLPLISNPIYKTWKAKSWRLQLTQTSNQIRKGLQGKSRNRQCHHSRLIKPTMLPLAFKKWKIK